MNTINKRSLNFPGCQWVTELLLSSILFLSGMTMAIADVLVSPLAFSVDASSNWSVPINIRNLDDENTFIFIERVGVTVGAPSDNSFTLSGFQNRTVRISGPAFPNPFSDEYLITADNGGFPESFIVIIDNDNQNPINSSNDIGVIPEFTAPGVALCPVGSEQVSIFMDNENSNNNNSRSGWIGATQSFGNTNFFFCRISGDLFKPLSSSNNVINHYAVLSLGPNCPDSSTRFSRYFDTQNFNNRDDSEGDISPNLIDRRGIEMQFCLFKSGIDTMSEFPAIGIDYGVFAASDFNLASDTGHIGTDDENFSNNNDFDAAPEDIIDAQRIIQPSSNGGRNTRLNTARVFPHLVPPTEPVAKCKVNPMGTFDAFVEAVFSDNGSFARNGANIVSFEWEFSDGSSDTGAGPIEVTLFGDQFSSPTIHYGDLTVTDSNGQVARTTCEVAIIGCDFGTCLDPTGG